MEREWREWRERRLKKKKKKKKKKKERKRKEKKELTKYNKRPRILEAPSKPIRETITTDKAKAITPDATVFVTLNLSPSYTA